MSTSKQKYTMQCKDPVDHKHSMQAQWNTPVVFFLSMIGAGLVLQSKAGIIGAIVAGSGGAGTAGADGHRAGAWQPRGVAPRPQPPKLVDYLHGFKHAPRVVPAGRSRLWVAIKEHSFTKCRVVISATDHKYDTSEKWFIHHIIPNAAPSNWMDIMDLSHI